MIVLLVIVWLAVLCCLLFVITARPVRTKHSVFELERRGDTAVLERERLLGDIYVFRKALAVLLIILLSAVGWILWQQIGIAIVIVALLVVALFSRTNAIKKFVMTKYRHYEPAFLQFAERWPRLGWLLGSDRHVTSDVRIESVEQLLHLVDTAGHVLSPEKQRLIKRSLQWHDATVAEVMVPKDRIVSVSHRELLGPLVLDDLHKSGHQRFPVMRGGEGDVLGMVDISELLRVDTLQKSPTAEKVMTPLEVRLRTDMSLEDALKELLDHPGQLGIVLDTDGSVTGMVTMDDVLKVLLG